MHFVGNDVKAIHQVLYKNRTKLTEQFAKLPGAYQIQMLNALEHLCDLNDHDFVIKPRASFIFTDDDEEEDIENNINENSTHASNINNELNEKHLNKNLTGENIDEENDENLNNDENIKINLPSTRTEELLGAANTQQRFLANFLKQYLAAIMRYEQSKFRVQDTLKPLPFHIIVNGLAGSGKSYAISIIEQMLTDFCISESAI